MYRRNIEKRLAAALADTRVMLLNGARLRAVPLPAIWETPAR
jgi:hypothetical protein